MVVTSIKLVKQLKHHSANTWFLTQSYLSTVLLFAGIYTLVARVLPSAFHGVFVSGDQDFVHELVFIRFICERRYSH